MALLKKKANPVVDRSARKPTLRDYQVIVSPVITEKSSLVGASGRNLVFKVHQDATKEEIRGAVQALFKVNVTAVRTCTYLGKSKRTNKGIGYRAGYRKAYVTLKEGETIDIVEGL